MSTETHYHPCNADCSNGLLAGSLVHSAKLIDVIDPAGHTYWSTHCRHGNHEACSATWIASTVWNDPTRRARIRRKPSQCKTCSAPCICPCHQEGHDA